MISDKNADETMRRNILYAPNKAVVLDLSVKTTGKNIKVFLLVETFSVLCFVCAKVKVKVHVSKH